MKEQEDTGMEAFDALGYDTYAKEAKERFGHTPEYGEYVEKVRGKSKEEMDRAAKGLMEIFVEFGKIKNVEDPSGAAAQELVKKLQGYISEHYYTCSKETLFGVASGYREGGSMNENIDKAGGKGCGEFAYQAVKGYCGR